MSSFIKLVLGKKKRLAGAAVKPNSPEEGRSLDTEKKAEKWPKHEF